MTVKESEVTNNDVNSQGYDFSGVQLDDGTGTLKLKDVVYGQATLTGVTLVLVP